MADTFMTSPRRVAVQIKLHAGECADVITQPAIIVELTDLELQKIDLAINAELTRRKKEKTL